MLSNWRCGLYFCNSVLLRTRTIAYNPRPLIKVLLMTDPLLSELKDSVIDGKRKIAKSAVEQLLEQNTPPSAILDALTAGMDVVGKRFKAGEVFVPEVLVSARAMKTGMELLEPVLVEAGMQPKHTIIIGTVHGDLHDIGKNLVAMMLKGANFNVVDAGTNVAPEEFVRLAKENNAHVVGLSALLTTTMPMMKNTVAAMRDAGIPVRVIVGGAPVTQQYCDEIGADGYSPDAASAVDLVRSLVAAA